ncbi:hypothetical protein E3O19_01470 [Cryobacterium algoritolerans]|uniref:Uncharacterized protein n=1 Tax=Cryobacterium algoritolerans TaxID=1259184 RepID=A0A4V3IFE5_9MICO|nr:hypothetical protein [Cryobacterium algoritolerans]TFC20068.1 hypothetical protein E3O19_01470 [Cryobacterium algoritolerans]
MSGYLPPNGAQIQYSLPAYHGAADRAAGDQLELLQHLEDALRAGLEIAEQTRADAARSERHSRIIAWCSFSLAVASLAAAVVAIFV